MKKNKIIDEIIKLKFPNAKKDDEKVNEFLENLFDEVLEIIDSCDEPENDGKISRLKEDEFPDNVSPFIVLQTKDKFLEFKCPHCLKEQKIMIDKFDRSQYKEIKCFNCSESFLIKLEFNPIIKTYLERS